jgi:hypothetical protein
VLLLLERKLPLFNPDSQEVAVVAPVEKFPSRGFLFLALEIRNEVVSVEMNLERLAAGVVTLGALGDDVGLTRSRRERGQKILVSEEIADDDACLITPGQRISAGTPTSIPAALRCRLFFSQVEYCDNLIFHRRAAIDQLGQRLLDANRSIGQPNKITVIFGRKVTKHYRGKLQTVIEDLELPNPVIRSHYANGFIKQYVRDRFCLRTESATNDVTDYGVKKAVENLPELHEKLVSICDNYLTV